jgi:hypothetical protein
MSEVLHANVFFFITGIAVIVFTMLLCVALVHAIKLLKSIRRIVARVEDGAETLHADMQSMRTQFVRGGIVGFVKSVLFGAPLEEENEEDMPPRAQYRKQKERKRNSLKIKDES